MSSLGQNHSNNFFLEQFLFYMLDALDLNEGIMGDQFTVITQAHVHVKISSNATSFISERNIPKDQSIAELKV